MGDLREAIDSLKDLNDLLGGGRVGDRSPREGADDGAVGDGGDDADAGTSAGGDGGQAGRFGDPYTAGVETLFELRAEREARQAGSKPRADEGDIEGAVDTVEEAKRRLSTLSELIHQGLDVADPRQVSDLRTIDTGDVVDRLTDGETGEETRSLREQMEQERQDKRSKGEDRHARTKRRLIRLGLVLLAATVISPFITDLTPAKPFAVATDSMEPAIPAGSLAVAVPGEVQPDDVIVYKSVTGKFQIHRVTGIQQEDGSTYYTTKGDANPAADSFSVPREDVSGVVTQHVPYMGHLWLIPLEVQVTAFVALLGGYLAITIWDDRTFFRSVVKPAAVSMLLLLVLPGALGVVIPEYPVSTTTAGVNDPTPFPFEAGSFGDATVSADQNNATATVDAPVLYKTIQVWGCDPDDTSDAGCTLTPNSTSYTFHNGTRFMPRAGWQPTSSLRFFLEAEMRAASGNTTFVRLYDEDNAAPVTASEISSASTTLELVRSGPIEPDGVDLSLGNELVMQTRASTADTGAVRMVRLVAELRYNWTDDKDIQKIVTQIPISGGDAQGGGQTAPSDRGAIFEFNETYFPKDTTLNKVQFEAVGWTDSNGGADVHLEDLTTGTTVATISFNQGDPITRAAPVDVTGDMVDGHEYEVQLDRGGGGGTVKVHNARLVVLQQSLAQRADWRTGRYVDLAWSDSTTSATYQAAGHPGIYHFATEFDNGTARLEATIANDNNNALTSLRALHPRGHVLGYVNRSTNSWARVQSDAFAVVDDDQTGNASYDAELKAGSGTARVRKAWIVVEQAPGRVWDHVLRTGHDGARCDWRFWVEYDGDPATAVDNETFLDNATVYLANGTTQAAQLVVEGPNGPARREPSRVVTVAPGDRVEHRVRFDANPGSGLDAATIRARLHGRCDTAGVHTVQHVTYKFVDVL